MFLASNAAAFLRETRSVVLPGRRRHRRDHAGRRASSRARTATVVEHEPVELDWDDEGAEKGGYETFMLKEIYEQAEAVAETIGDRVRHGTLVLEGLGHWSEELRELRRIVILACGTAYHAGVVGAVRDRGVGAHSGRAGHRLRVDLPQPGDRQGHARDRDLAVRRDARHDRGDEARPRSWAPAPSRSRT